jgi:hypothetical protein
MLPAVNRRDIVIGFIILIVLAIIVYWVSRPEEPTPTPSPTPVPIEEVERRLEDQLRRTLPETGDRVGLEDVTGGDSSGLAVKEKTDTTTNVSLLADLPDLVAGSFYQAWLIRTVDNQEEKLSLGRLVLAKGGYSLEYSTRSDLEDYDKLVVSLEKTFDNTEEQRILEGGF